ncbi:MAG: signal peptidase I [Bacillota bacterium]|nr:signal peptidase I [Bacillota bacterium]
MIRPGDIRYGPSARPGDPSPPSRRTSFLLEVLDWIKYILIAIVLGLAITTFVLQRNEVVGNSMYPTLYHGDQLWVEKITHHFGGVGRGDIITFSTANLPGGHREEDLVKRVIGLPGERVEIRDGAVYINGERLAEPYLAESVVTEPRLVGFADLTLAANEYYVLGDNRPDSSDSRVFGPIREDDVIGETLIRVFPLDRFGRP